jgi:hypothetical protein
LSGWRQVPFLELEMCSTWQCSNGKDGSMECPLGPDAARPTNKGEGIFINAACIVLKGGFALSVNVGKPSSYVALMGIGEDTGDLGRSFALSLLRAGGETDFHPALSNRRKIRTARLQSSWRQPSLVDAPSSASISAFAIGLDIKSLA